MSRPATNKKGRGSVEWETPTLLFELLDHEFHFDLDLAATKKNALCASFYTPEDNSLIQPWGKHVGFLNPPFRLTSQFMRKAAQERRATVVAIVMSSVDTRWWYEYILGEASEIRFIIGRVQFGMNGEIPRVGTRKRKSALRCGAAVIVFRPRSRKVVTKVKWGLTWPGRE